MPEHIINTGAESHITDRVSLILRGLQYGRGKSYRRNCSSAAYIEIAHIDATNVVSDGTAGSTEVVSCGTSARGRVETVAINITVQAGTILTQRPRARRGKALVSNDKALTSFLPNQL